ncbi:MAG TPA: hypothetical protein V6D14_33050 [Coleofasciculaceae cyanobacterium]|jgi:probable HAF family extracellular repeat protein
MKTRLLRNFWIGLVGAAVMALGLSILTHTSAAITFSYTITDLGTFGGTNSYASGINDAGQVVGYAATTSGVSGDRHAFLWENGTMKDLGAPANYFAEAGHINDRGQVVGIVYNRVDHYFAALWERGKLKDLNSLIPANSGWELIRAEDINKKGQIVGWGFFNGQGRAFLLTPTWVIQ